MWPFLSPDNKKYSSPDTTRQEKTPTTEKNMDAEGPA